jgi:hypothetical protein
MLACGGKIFLRGSSTQPLLIQRLLLPATQDRSLVPAAPVGLEQRRGMARGRNYYLKGASNKDEISPEARDLLINQR